MAAIPGEPTDYSGTITTGGTAQELVTGNLGRMYLFIQNVSSSDLWINFGSVDAEPDSPSIKIQPDLAIVWESGLGFVPSSNITIYGATTGQAFTVKEG
jgi:hypothetical protein